ncbi:hypothetical protein [Thiobacillus denitrificans]|nr:hypothetical protein [Thiobacillus denitrificans]
MPRRPPRAILNPEEAVKTTEARLALKSREQEPQDLPAIYELPLTK